MTKHDIEFRAQEPEPTIPGYYYARLKGQTKITPRVVINEPSGLAALLLNGNASPLRHYDWFGPVREVQEASGG